MAHTLMLEMATEAFASREISFMQWLVLTKLRDGVATTAGDLCRHTRYDTGALTRLLDQLEKRGFVKRERSLKDRRVVHLQLTAAGRKQALELTPLVIERLNATLAGFSKTEFHELTRLLNKLIAALQAPELALQEAAS
jgi:DNA-binding MarR family transcriptional regulator